jgi:hypothetical protein
MKSSPKAEGVRRDMFFLWAVVIENIAHRTKAFKIYGVLGMILEVFTQSHHEIIHSPSRCAPRVSPPDFQQMLAGKRFSPVGDKKFQKLHFLFGQNDFSAFAIGRRVTEIDLVTSKSVSLRYGR